MKMAVLVTIASVAWFVYFQFIDWLFMQIQGLDYFTFLKI